MSDDFPNRQTFRLKNYDYSRNGMYFITICTNNHENMFGEITNGKMALNEIGKIVEAEWLKLKNRFTNIELHEFIVMTNHIHGIIEIVGAGFTSARPTYNKTKHPHNANYPHNTNHPDIANQSDNSHKSDYDYMDRAEVNPAPTVGEIVCAYKSIVSHLCLNIYKSKNIKMGKLWQRNYHEHIIRDENSYHKIVDYIQNNPSKWQNDIFFRQS